MRVQTSNAHAIKKMAYKSILCEAVPPEDCPKIDLGLCDFDTFLSRSSTCPNYASILDDHEPSLYFLQDRSLQVPPKVTLQLSLSIK
jgi:hypothetical protein